MQPLHPGWPWRWRWPLPALAAWAAGSAVAAALHPLERPLALVAGAAVACALAWPIAGRWRRTLAMAGFPLLMLAAGGVLTAIPAVVWLLAAALLLLIYPPGAWRDAPLFPTPARALDALAPQLALPAGARVLDAGCGLGHGLRALRSAWPQAIVEGIERSPLLALWVRVACPWARVRQGDLWADSWHGLALVYLFQRPESMERAWRKARAELAPGAWLVSLAFEVPGVPPTLTAATPGGGTVHAWRIAPQSRGPAADIPS